MKEIKYYLQFVSYWSCGSGLDAGVESDVLPIKDAEGLPFVPGKTIKGVLREAAGRSKEAHFFQMQFFHGQRPRRYVAINFKVSCSGVFLLRLFSLMV